MRAELLALLEDGPHQAGELASWLNEDKLAVIRTLKALKADGHTWRTDRPDGTTWWSLAGTAALHVGASQPEKPLKSRKKLQQLDEHPKRILVPTDSPPSWWCALSREEFSAQVKRRADALSRSPMARHVQNRMLQ